MRPHVSLLIVVVALGASSAAIAASTSTSSGGGASSAGSGGAHGGGGGGGHDGGVGGHAAFGGGFSNSGRFGSANLGRGSFTQAVGNHAAGHAIAVRIAPDKTHPGNPEHHHRMIWRGTDTNQVFGHCAAIPLNRDADFPLGPNAPCGGAVKATTNPRTGRPAG
jgi:hypothetical protein